jgi:C2 domain
MAVAILEHEMEGMLVGDLCEAFPEGLPQHVAQESEGQVAAYVEVMVYDPQSKQTQQRNTTTEINDPAPRFSQTFDFVNVSTEAKVTATVYDRSGSLSKLFSMKPWAKVGAPCVGWYEGIFSVESCLWSRFFCFVCITPVPQAVVRTFLDSGSGGGGNSVRGAALCVIAHGAVLFHHRLGFF